MLIISLLVKTVAAFVTLFVCCRILGKKLISQMTFFDLVASITLGTIAGSVIFTEQIPWWASLSVLTLFALLTFVNGLLALKSRRAEQVLNGHPLVLIRNGQIDCNAMQRSRLTMQNLMALLRGKDVFYIHEVAYAVLETEGSLSVMKTTNLKRSDAVEGTIPGIPVTAYDALKEEEA
ncbi:DUF421 domain-containing protein [Paenibacillus athensensis]|uniref:DUF421 domain-containing protein n=1 Tax=Paenibacillus athensensis TaxID=1967502 RepID=A0A4Y8Q071_9BACL|nr:YetF domain-containing protein [Paenibacillus athensensis]MCD1261084.1 DUF421 domain-containing protein [Paenibacillus athensensis]